MTNHVQPPRTSEFGRFQLIIPDDEGMPAPNPEAFKLAGSLLAGVVGALMLAGVIMWVVLGR